ncbi:hypothetical protein AB0H43_28630 [Hamadaea sp. NPDC050747]|uniref:hypothetical protein n=1 Tax=Hamadaea sp. NPDC050747 TaxID=3155789 RepID=UPI00340EE650
MTAPAVTPGQLTDDVDVDAIVEAVRRCPGVEDLYAGSPVELATYLPGRRVVGVRVTESAVEVQIRTRWGRTIPEIGAAVLAAVAPLSGGRPVDVLVADVVGEPGEDAPAGTPAAKEPVAPEPVTSKPASSEPVTSKPMATEPIAAEPIAKEPVAREAVPQEPGTAGSAGRRSKGRGTS